jgi:hypothetical protein
MTQKTIKILRSDNGVIIYQQPSSNFVKRVGFLINTIHYIPQQNGVVERKNRTLMEASRSMMQAT